MEIKILFFGITKDITNTSKINLSLNGEEIILRELKIELQKKYPNLKDLDIYAFAVNETYATNDSKIVNQDVVAIIPPVSGG